MQGVTSSGGKRAREKTDWQSMETVTVYIRMGTRLVAAKSKNGHEWCEESGSSKCLVGSTSENEGTDAAVTHCTSVTRRHRCEMPS